MCEQELLGTIISLSSRCWEQFLVLWKTGLQFAGMDLSCVCAQDACPGFRRVAQVRCSVCVDLQRCARPSKGESRGSGCAIKQTWIQIPAPQYSIHHGKAVGETNLSEEVQRTGDAWVHGPHGVVGESGGSLGTLTLAGKKLDLWHSRIRARTVLPIVLSSAISQGCSGNT